MASKGKGTTDASPPSNSNLPKSWNTVRFGDVVRDVNEAERNPVAAGLERFVGLEHIEPENLHLKQWGMLADSEISFRKRFRKGQVLFGKRRAYQRKVAVAEFDGICSSDILTFEPKGDALIPELLPFIVQSDGFFKYALGTSSGSLSPRTRWSQLQDYEFPLPPKDEQRHIADILWVTDEAIEQHQAASHESSRLLEALRDDIFRQHLRKGTTIPLGDVGEWRSGGTPSRSNADFWGGDFPWVSPKDMKVTDIQDSEEHLTPEGKSEASVVPRDAILLVIRGMILAHTFPVAITTREVAFNQDIKAIIASEAFDPHYVYHWLRCQSMTILGMVADSSHGTKRLPMEPVLSLRIPTPDRKTQSEAVRLFHQTVEMQSRLMAHTESLRQLKSQLMHRLLTPGDQPDAH